MIATRQPRRVERERFSPDSRMILVENDLDENDRDHESLETRLKARIAEAETRINKEIASANAKVDRLTKAAITLAATFTTATIALIYNLVQDKL